MHSTRGGTLMTGDRKNAGFVMDKDYFKRTRSRAVNFEPDTSEPEDKKRKELNSRKLRKHKSAKAVLKSNLKDVVKEPDIEEGESILVIIPDFNEDLVPKKVKGIKIDINQKKTKRSESGSEESVEQSEANEDVLNTKLRVKKKRPTSTELHTKTNNSARKNVPSSREFLRAKYGVGSGSSIAGFQVKKLSDDKKKTEETTKLKATIAKLRKELLEKEEIIVKQKQKIAGLKKRNQLLQQKPPPTSTPPTPSTTEKPIFRENSTKFYATISAGSAQALASSSNGPPSARRKLRKHLFSKQIGLDRMTKRPMTTVFQANEVASGRESSGILFSHLASGASSMMRSTNFVIASQHPETNKKDNKTIKNLRRRSSDDANKDLQSKLQQYAEEEKPEPQRRLTFAAPSRHRGTSSADSGLLPPNSSSGSRSVIIFPSVDENPPHIFDGKEVRKQKKN
jgi:hypothetical protein